MDKALEKFDNATELLARAEADIAFHSLIAKATQNPVLQVMYGSVITLTFEIMLRSLADPTVDERGAPIHHDILSAIKARDPKAAADAMGRHLHLAEDTYDADLDIPLSEVANRVIKEKLGSSRTIHDVLDSAFKNYSLDILR
jgi:GntR family transcriptional repressor for pyruvate dehydrogenase complex